MFKNNFRLVIPALLLALAVPLLVAQTGAPAAAKLMGAIQKISGNQFSLATDQGVVVQVGVQPGARLLRFAPGQGDSKSATPIQLSELQVGDRVLVRGAMSDDKTVFNASAVAVMKQQDIAKLQQHELLDWQRRSVGGVVKQVEAASGTINLVVAGKPIAVMTTPKTTYKRYSPDSVRWEDATSARLADIHPGDQLRAKGNKSEDGSQITAEEVVAGTFRNISGLVSSVDAIQNTVTVQDLSTKKPISVKFTTDSQMKVLPRQLALGLAIRLKGGVAAPGGATPQPQPGQSGAAPGQPGERPRNGGDLNQLIARLPSATLADLHKGDAVMILSTEGSSATPPTAITLLGGVEPLLTAAPSGTAAQSFLTPWSLASAPGGDQQ
jgi:hypothetical protein